MFKNIKKVFIIYLILFITAINGSYYNTHTNREMIILIDNYETLETILNNSYNNAKVDDNDNLHSIAGAITLKCLSALHQEAAPILASKSLIINLIKAKNMLGEFLNYDKQVIYNKYCHTNKFNSLEFTTIFQKCFKISYDLYTYINANLKFKLGKLNKGNSSLAYSVIDNIIKEKSNLIKEFNSSISKYFNSKTTEVYFITDIVTNILRYSIKYENWIIKNVDKDFYLLIPKSYLNKLNIKPQDTLHKTNLDQALNKMTDIELKLGLKVNHLQDINLSKVDIFGEKTSSFNKDKNEYINKKFIDSLSKIFVTKSDSSNSNLNKWALYCSGHGVLKGCENIFLPQLQDINEYYIQHNIKSKNINPIFDHFNYNKYAYYNLNGKIINLDQEEFTDFLLFLNNQIETVFLYYSTCFSGGSSLIEPYIKNNKSLILNYDIVSEAISEVYSTQEWMSLKIPGIINYSLNSNISKNIIDFKKKELKIITSLNFKKYFKHLNMGLHNNTNHLKKVIYKLNPYFYFKGNAYYIKNINNLPSIRHKYTNNFNIIDVKDYTNLQVIAAENNNTNNLANKKFILLYQDYVNKPITINNNLKCMVSMSTSKGHLFETVQAPNLNINDVIDKFLFFKELGCPKFFWIKNLICKDINYPYNTIQLSDFIITNNILSSENMRDFDNFYDIINYNYIYFQNKQLSNNVYKVVIPKNFDKNLSLLNAQKMDFKNYKEEILSLQPHLNNYLNNNHLKFA